MGINTPSLLDKFKTGIPQTIQTSEVQRPEVKFEDKQDEVTLSNDAKPKKTTAHYAGKGAGIGATIGLGAVVLLYVCNIGKNIIKKKLPFKEAIKPYRKFEKNITYSGEIEYKYIGQEWNVGMAAGLTGIATAAATLLGNVAGAVTGLIKNRKKDAK